MNIISFEEAETIVEGLKDGRDRRIEPGIAEALTHFVRFAKALGIETFQSCEGHIDWGLPFPWIDFRVPRVRIKVPPLWKVWKLRSRYSALQENKKHLRNEEEKTEQLCTIMTRYLIRHAKIHGLLPETILCIHRRQSSTFRLLPAYQWLSEGYKKASDHHALNTLLILQRETMISFAAFCVAELKKERNLIGVPKDGCRGCMGRG